jgi:hypothetical protein
MARKMGGRVGEKGLAMMSYIWVVGWWGVREGKRKLVVDVRRRK